MARQEMFAGQRSTDDRLKPYYLRPAGQGQVDILDSDGTVVAGGLQVDDLVLSLLQASSPKLPDGRYRRATAYAAVTGATATLTVAVSAQGVPSLTNYGALAIEDPLTFCARALKCGYEDRDMAMRWIAFGEARVS